MTVSPTKWVAGTFAAVETLLANSATFRTLMGAGDVAAAKAKCVWQDSRAVFDAPGTLLQIRQGTEGQSEALRVVRHSDAVYAYMVWTPQAQSGDTEKDKITRELNSFGALLDELEQLIGSGTYIERALLEWEPPSRTPDKGPRSGCFDATITFRWEI